MPASIIRVVHNRENPYVQLNKGALWDSRLSLKAVGLWARCLSKKDDWKFNVRELASKMKEGKASIYGAIEELIENGYVIKIEYSERSESGRFCAKRVEYIFFEFTLTKEDEEDYIDKFKKSFPNRDFQYDGVYRRSKSRDIGDWPIIISSSSEEDLKEESEKEPEAPPPPPPPKPKERKEEPKENEDLKTSWEFRHGRVRMKEKEFGALIEEFGEERVKLYLTKLDRYGNTNPKRFKQYENHAEKIREWILEDSHKSSLAKTDTAAGRAAARAESEADNRYLADRIAKDLSSIGMGNVIYAGASYIQFTYGDKLFAIRYHDPDFRKKVAEHLKNLKTPLKGL